MTPSYGKQGISGVDPHLQKDQRMPHEAVKSQGAMEDYWYSRCLVFVEAVEWKTFRCSVADLG
jgi:hypothetical protein